MEVEKVRSLYASLRPLMLTEKILVTHAADFDRQVRERGKPGKDTR